MNRPVVAHVKAWGRTDPDLDAVLATMTATVPVTGQVRRADVVHAHGLGVVPRAVADATRLVAPLVVSLGVDDVARIADMAGDSDGSSPAADLRGAAAVVVTRTADVDPLVAAGCSANRVVVIATARTISAPVEDSLLGSELGGCVADLEEHYLAVIRTGWPATPRPPRTEWPRVAVVVVTYNRRAMLARCLAAIEAQSYPSDRVDVVVVDNATSDGSAEFLAQWARSPRRTVVTFDDHVVPSVARNAAVSRVDAELVAFTDDDCFPTRDWLVALACSFRGDVAIVQGRIAPDPDASLEPLSRTQWTPAEYGAYETANVAYRRDQLPSGPFDPEFSVEVTKVLGRRLGENPFGEDAELAWRVKRAGGASRFSATALVHHAVWPSDRGYLMRRAVTAAAFPVLVRQVPELRETLLWRRWFLSRRGAELTVATVGLVAATRRPGFGLLALPYLWSRLRPTTPGRRARAAALPTLVARDVVEQTALVYGSIKARTPVL